MNELKISIVSQNNLCDGDSPLLDEDATPFRATPFRAALGDAFGETTGE